MKRISRNGFTLISAMIGLLLVASTTLGIAHLSEISAKSVKYLKSAHEFESLIQELNEVFSEQKTCEGALRDSNSDPVYFFNAPPEFEVEVDAIQVGTNTPILKKGTPIGEYVAGGLQLKREPIDLDDIPADPPSPLLNQHITKLRLILEPRENNEGTAQVYGGPRVHKIPLRIFTKTTGEFVTCQISSVGGGGETASTPSPQETCMSLGGTWNPEETACEDLGTAEAPPSVTHYPMRCGFEWSDVNGVRRGTPPPCDPGACMPNFRAVTNLMCAKTSIYQPLVWGGPGQGSRPNGYAESGYCERICVRMAQ